MHGQSGERSSEYGSTGVPIECAGRAVEGVLSMYGWGFYRMHGQSGGRSSEYGSTGVLIECAGRVVKGVLNMEVQEFL